MKTKIGVIAPQDSLEQILYVTDEFKDIEVASYTYDDLSDIEDILSAHRYEVDQWFFSGILNYTYAYEKNLITPEEGSYPPLHGSSFFGILLEAQLTSKKVFEKVSIDTITDDEIEKILSYYDLQSLTYYNHPFEGYQYSNELVDFHSNLYKEGKAEVAITSIKTVYRQLKALGVPVFRVTPSYLSIKLILQFLEERAQSKRLRNAQVAVIGCRVDFEVKQREELQYSFRMKHQELDLRRFLLRIAEKTSGSLMQIGDGVFFIFTTRGQMWTEVEEELFSLIQNAEMQTSSQVNIAIGFGETVSQAEQNVRFGFRNYKTFDEPTLLIVDEYQSITLKQQEAAISYQTVGAGEWADKIKDAALSPGVVSKIISYAHHYERTTFTSQDLSRWLQSTERNGRRILSEMEKVGLVQQSGEAQSGERGRPRKVFSLVLDQ
ncbi:MULTISPECIES: ATP-binding protein [Pontibacillus]|uniref:ATP-binding protein n=1 Tax=Pontibacillus chungwhensis TaxID=265426 RepID=A0ABY8UYU4_9BACI|nr:MULTISPECIES: ATP-binding protein [Pontibacillus]MCD5324235.1 ATP-binding protein [Pontibacillus sp. HN14]WIF97709.1 ATP-binding protein [Pontibacillus chungwhensis]